MADYAVARVDVGPDAMAVMLPIPADIAAKFPESAGWPHVTLAYLGDVPEELTDDVALIVADELCERFSTIGRENDWSWYEFRPRLHDVTLTLGGLSYFESDPRVAYLTVAASTGLYALRDRILVRLAAIGVEIPNADRPWVPHATLAYIEPGTFYRGPMPTGSWEFRGVEVWRGEHLRYIIGSQAVSGIDKVERIGDMWTASRDAGRVVVGEFPSEAEARTGLRDDAVDRSLTCRYDKLAKRGGKWVALSADGTKEFGTYETEEEARERLRQVEAAKAAKADRADAERTEVEKTSIRVRFEDLVNMTPSEGKKWRDSPFSGPNRKTGKDRERALRVFNRALRVAETPADEWDAKDYDDANQVIAFIERMREVKQGEPLVVDGREGPSARDAALMDWLHDPRKDASDTRADAKTSNRPKWIWRTQQDGRVRDAHARLDGKKFDIHQHHGTEGQPGSAWNCRCWPEMVPMRGTKRELAVIERTSKRAQRLAMSRWDAAPEQRVLFDTADDGTVTLTIPAGIGVGLGSGGTDMRADSATVHDLSNAMGQLARADRQAPAVHTESRAHVVEVTRADRIELPAEVEPIVHPDGWVAYPVLYSRAGNIQVYDGVREYRPREEVFARKSMDTGIGVPWELRHSADLLRPDTVDGVARGCVLTVDEYHDNCHTFGWAKAWSRDLLIAIEGENGQRPEAPEVSVAYRCKVDKRPGTDDFGSRFDQRQFDIIWNSLASEPHGRAETARVLKAQRADGITVHGAGELLALATAPKPPTSRVFCDLRSWARFDSSRDRKPAAPNIRQDASPMKNLLMLAMKAGLSKDDIAKAVGIVVDELGPLLAGEKNLDPDQLNALIMALPDMPDMPSDEEDEDEGETMDMEMAKVMIGEAEMEVPKAVAEHIKMLEDKAGAADMRSDRAGKRADAAEDALAKTKAELQTRVDAQADMVTRADAQKMVQDHAMHVAEAIELARRAHGPEFKPEARKDAETGDALAISAHDWQMAAIRGAFGDKADAIIARIDAAPTAEARAYAINERLADARERLDARMHKGEEALASIARMRTNNAEHDRADADEDPLAARQKINKQYANNYVGAPTNPQTNGAG